MKTLTMTLASALIALSFNSFAGTCNPCGTTEILGKDSIIAVESEMPKDVNVNDVLQKMTVTVHQQVVGPSTTDSKKHKHEKRKARG